MSITQERPVDISDDVDVDQLDEGVTDQSSRGFDGDTQTRVGDDGSDVTGSNDRSEHAARDYDHGDAPPMEDADVETSEFANPT